MIYSMFKITTQPLITSSFNPIKNCNVLTAFKVVKRSINFGDVPEDYTPYFATLKVPKNSDQETVRQAFLKLVKRFHPDCGSPEASVDKFNKTETAYRKLQNKFADERWNANKFVADNGPYREERTEPKDHDIKQHTAPQHRQYLNYEGVGVGTPSQRQKQYEKKRAVSAMENFTGHHVERLKQSRAQGLVHKEKTAPKKTKSRSAVQRLVEELIQESMARGEFDNLAGYGKPQSFSHHNNPYIDYETHKMNEVLIDNGFTPEWITLHKQIRTDLARLRSRLSKARAALGAHPITEDERREWNARVKCEEEALDRLNKKINHFNLLVPFVLMKQMVFVNLRKESKRILKYGRNKNNPPPVDKDKNKKKKNGHRKRAKKNEQGLFAFLEDIITNS